MKQFARGNSSNILSIDGNQRSRRTASVDELNLVGDTALVHMNCSPDITAMQLLMIRLAI